MEIRRTVRFRVFLVVRLRTRVISNGREVDTERICGLINSSRGGFGGFRCAFWCM